MTAIRSLPIDQIRHRADARSRSDEALAALVESLEQIGLINPIRVRQIVENGYEVVAGSHRLQAAELASWMEIDCIVVDTDDLHAELAMIDENLCRAELSPADRARQTARRKAIYLELHPETAHGGNTGGPSGQFVHTAEPSFAKETANATGRDERAVRRDAERGEKVIPEVLDMVRGTKLDRGVYLDQIKGLSPNDQVAAAKRDLAYDRRQEREAPAQGGVAARIAQKPANEIDYEQLRAAILLLCDLKPDDFIRLCPQAKRAAMFQKLGHLETVFSQVRERV